MPANIPTTLLPLNVINALLDQDSKLTAALTPLANMYGASVGSSAGTPTVSQADAIQYVGPALDAYYQTFVLLIGVSLGSSGPSDAQIAAWIAQADAQVQAVADMVTRLITQPVMLNNNASVAALYQTIMKNLPVPFRD